MKVRELGHVVLYVGDVHKSAAFYHDALGWDFAIPPSPGSPIAAFSGGRTHHELLLSFSRCEPSPRCWRL